MFKKYIPMLLGKRKKVESLDLTKISSILLKPTGDAIGDAITHTAHLNQLRKFNPKLKIGVIVTDRNRCIFSNSNLADELIKDTPSSYFKQRKKWDLYLDFQPTFTTSSIVLEKILEPNYIIVFNKKDKKHYNLKTVKNFNARFTLNNNIHISDYLSESPLGIFLNKYDAFYQLHSEVVGSNIAPTVWKENKYRVLISPQGSNREIPVGELADFLNKIEPSILKNTIFLVSVMRDKEIYLSQLKEKVINEVLLDDLPNVTISEYLEIVKSSDLIVSVDSGTVHLACALQKPLLAFYANNKNNIKKWQPKSLSNNYCMIISNIESDSNHTSGFDMQKAAQWFNNNLEKSLS